MAQQRLLYLLTARARISPLGSNQLRKAQQSLHGSRTHVVSNGATPGITSARCTCMSTHDLSQEAALPTSSFAACRQGCVGTGCGCKLRPRAP